MISVDQEMPGSTGPPARSFKETQEKDEGSVLGGIRGEGRLSFSESMLIHWCFLQPMVVGETIHFRKPTHRPKFSRSFFPACRHVCFLGGLLSAISP